MITAYGDAETRRKAIERGAAGSSPSRSTFPSCAAKSTAGSPRRGLRMTAKILVVDDEPDLEDLVTQKFRRQIRDGAFAFGFARDGVEALASSTANRDFDMVVSDINMPRMDGLTLLAKLQERGDEFSTVIVSAYGDMANIRTAMNRGAFDFLTKPIDFADFETTIRKTIAHVAALREARERQAAAERAQPRCRAISRPTSREPRRRAGRARARRRAARDRDAVHRHRRLHAAGGIARPDELAACSAAISTA